MKHLNNILFTLTAAILLTSCVTSGRKIEQSSVDKIQKGVTTRAEVLQLLGSPDQLTRDSSGKVTMNYHYMRATAKPEGFIPVVGLFAGGANTQNQSVIVVCGSDGIVSDVISTMGASEAGMGLSSGSKATVNEVEDNKRAK